MGSVCTHVCAATTRGQEKVARPRGDPPATSAKRVKVVARPQPQAAKDEPCVYQLLQLY